jgi:hypothetical protein
MAQGGRNRGIDLRSLTGDRGSPNLFLMLEMLARRHPQADLQVEAMFDNGCIMLITIHEKLETKESPVHYDSLSLIETIDKYFK